MREVRSALQFLRHNIVYDPHEERPSPTFAGNKADEVYANCDVDHRKREWPAPVRVDLQWERLLPHVP